jgi:hypothetical protein
MHAYNQKLVLEEYFPAVWQEADEDRRSWYIAHFDLLSGIRTGLFKIALIIKVGNAISQIFTLYFPNSSSNGRWKSFCRLQKLTKYF